MTDDDAEARAHAVGRFRTAMSTVIERLIDTDAALPVLQAVAGAAEATRDTLLRAPTARALWGHISRRDPGPTGLLVLGVGVRPVPPLHAAHEGDAVLATFTLGQEHEGPDGSAHGGVIATLFDEVLAQLHPAVSVGRARTAWLRVEYVAPVPLGELLSITGTVSNVSGRKVETSGDIRCAGEILARATAMLVAVD